ncbi:MAG TPA: glycosyltransferase family 2 protein [bacterium]|nr:glycosyltransferase family 2 protein [bacterium]HPQ66311.1 glycosyltransferase family 2 protein [bacterium]
MKDLSVAVIIPVHNDAGWLPECLAAVGREAQPRGWEVVVVDDASTDRSAEIAEEAEVRVIRLAENRGVSVSRNTGAHAVSADILVFVDSDVVPEPGCLQAMVDILNRRPEVHAVGAYPLPGDLSPEWSSHFVGLRSAWGYHWEKGETERPFSSIQSECGAIRSEVFRELGGFVEWYGGVGMEEFHMSHEMERRGYGHLLLRSAAYKHHYKRLCRRCRALMDRTARWVPLVVRRKKFESRGAVGTLDAAASAVLTMLILAGLVGGLAWCPLWAFTAIMLLIQMVIERRFLSFSARIYGPGMVVYALFALQALNLAIGAGFIYGLYKYWAKER